MKTVNIFEEAESAFVEQEWRLESTVAVAERVADQLRSEILQLSSVLSAERISQEGRQHAFQYAERALQCLVIFSAIADGHDDDRPFEVGNDWGCKLVSGTKRMVRGGVPGLRVPNNTKGAMRMTEDGIDDCIESCEKRVGGIRLLRELLHGLRSLDLHRWILGHAGSSLVVELALAESDWGRPAVRLLPGPSSQA